jgi:hypothetical protein
MASALTHRCPVTPCPREVPRNHLMCGTHWRMVPPPLRSAVWRAFGDGSGLGSRALLTAQRAAIAAVHEQLAGGTDG